MAFRQRLELRALIRNGTLALAAMLLARSAGAATATAPQPRMEAVSVILRATLEAPKAPPTESDGAPAAVASFYRSRDFWPAWINDPVAAQAVLAAVGRATAEGLDPGQYALPRAVAPSVTADELARYDLTLTEAALHYAHDLRRGEIDPAKADRLVGLTRPSFDPVSSLATALADNRLPAWLASLAPTEPEYDWLKAGLVTYRRIVADGGWSQVPDVRKIELKADNPMLVPLERRLAAEDPELARAADSLAVSELEAAVKRFQTRNGLDPDGVVGRKTIQALNISASDRVAQIEANMERWRWLPRRMPPRYIAVNTADATLILVDDGKTVLSSRVIVGKPKTQTAIFTADAVAITINPPWNVPTSIARNEILPKLRHNPDYLVKHHMIEMGAPDRIQQLPGEDNSLGYIKLEMPNPFSMFLHDTNARSLFARDDRHLSHGCIRVQNIRPLAAYLLAGDAASGLDRVNAAIETGETQKIVLDKPLPVFVLYWTAIARADGTVDFRPDAYGRDKRLIAALAGQRGQAAASSGVTECSGWTG